MRQEEVGILNVHGVESDAFLKLEQRGMEPVPETERHGSARELALVWAGAMTNYVSLLTGALVIGAPLVLGLSQGQLGLVDSAIALIIVAPLHAPWLRCLNPTLDQAPRAIPGPTPQIWHQTGHNRPGILVIGTPTRHQGTIEPRRRLGKTAHRPTPGVTLYRNEGRQPMIAV